MSDQARVHPVTIACVSAAAVFALFAIIGFAYEAGQNSVRNDCELLGSFSIGSEVYECQKR